MSGSVENTSQVDAEHTLQVEPAGLPTRSAGSHPEVGSRLGRYVLVSTIGRGGMGKVMRGYDPKLRREVAIKLLHSDSRQDRDARQRMIREAQAMARLSHQNIVAVYDVDEEQGQSFIAMEFVGGDTLSVWLQQPRSWREVLHVMEQAGAGLAAAHSAGVIHRDFKPSNVMLGDDDRARVTDFGIAHTAFEMLPSEQGADIGDDAPSELTRTGSVVGTPSYMAPEVHEGQRGDARSDIYAFCVTFWEALYGARPFAPPLDESKRDGPPAPPADSTIPGWLHRVVARGLEPDPSHRFASMKELLAALRRPTRRWRRRLAIGTILLGAGSVVGVQSLIERHHRLECEQQGRAIDSVWNDSVAAQMRSSFARTGVTHADDAFGRVVPWLDEYTARWSAERTAACQDARLGSWSEETSTRSRACFEQRRLDLQALLAVLLEADDDVVGRAVTAASKLSSVTPCRDAAWLSRRPPAEALDSDANREEIRQRLARADMLVKVDKVEQARVASTWVLEQLADHPDDELRLEAQIVHADAIELTGDFTRARRALEDAFHVSLGLGFDEIAHAAALRLVWVVGYDQGELERAREWGTLARGLARRLELEDEPAVAALLQNLAAVEFRSGNYKPARKLYEEALEVLEKRLGPDHPDVGGALVGLGAVLAEVGELGEARVTYERGLTLIENAYGQWHRDVSRATGSLGTLAFAEGDYALAVERFEHAIEILEQLMGSQHVDLDGLYLNRGVVLSAMGNYEAAAEQTRHAIELAERNRGADHPVAASGYDNLGLIARMQGDIEQATTLHEKALQIREKALGPDHVEVAASLTHRGIAHRLRGNLEQAKADHTRALAIRMRVHGPDHPEVATALNNLGNVEADLGRHEDARSLHQRALDIQRNAAGDEHPGTAELMLSVGRDLLRAKKHDEGLQLFQRAFGIFERTVGSDHAGYLQAMLGVAEGHMVRGEPEEALTWLDRAVRTAEGSKAHRGSLPEVRFAYAEALWHHDRQESIAQAERAMAEYTSLGSAGPAEQTQAWLHEHRD